MMRSVLCAIALAAMGCERRAPVPEPRPPAPPLASDGVKTRLFADDVAADTLPLSIAIETLGGVSTVLIPRGAPLPTERRETFSTAADDQSSVEVVVVQGERPLAKDNRLLGRFHLSGIPPAPRGVPQIDVTFAVDRQGVLWVGAKDRATDAHQSIQVSGAARALDRKQIDQALAEARAAEAEDRRAGAWNEARNDLDSLVYTARKLLAETGAKLTPALRARCQREIQQAEAFLAAHRNAGDLQALLAVKESLRNELHAVSTALYQGAAPAH